MLHGGLSCVQGRGQRNRGGPFAAGRSKVGFGNAGAGHSRQQAKEHGSVWRGLHLIADSCHAAGTVCGRRTWKSENGGFSANDVCAISASTRWIPRYAPPTPGVVVLPAFQRHPVLTESEDVPGCADAVVGVQPSSTWRGPRCATSRPRPFFLRALKRRQAASVVVWASQQDRLLPHPMAATT